MKLKNIQEATSVDSIIEFLESKGENHNYYYHYTTWDSFEKIYNNKSFLLTRGNSLAINDQHEAIMKGSWEMWNKTYIGSFAYGSSENMAMWGLYGLPWEDAVRIAIPKEVMLLWIKNIKSVSLWNDGVKGTIDNIKISLPDIVYVSGKSGSNTLKLTHNEKSFTTSNVLELHSIAIDPRMTGYIKNYAWRYENEVRIRVVLPEDTGFEKILLDIPQQVIDSMQITTGPYFIWKNSQLYHALRENKRISESGFKNLVRYKALCTMCAHGNFARKEN